MNMLFLASLALTGVNASDKESFENMPDSFQDWFQGGTSESSPNYDYNAGVFDSYTAEQQEDLVTQWQED